MTLKSSVPLCLYLLFVGCSETAPVDSELHGSLLENPLACQDYSDAQYAELESKLSYDKFFKGFNGPSDKKRLLKHLYGIPQKYRDIMIDLNNRGHFQGIIHGQTSGTGFCQYTPEGPTKIVLSNTFSQSIEFSMIHESGHGMTFIAGNDAGLSSSAFRNKIIELMDEGRKYNSSRKSNEPKIRAYALSKDSEYWADTFSDYYCSPKTHEFLKAKLPKNYAFVSSFLEAPVWASMEPTIPDSPAKDYALTLGKLFSERSPGCPLQLKNLVLGDKSKAQAQFQVGEKSKMSMLDFAFDTEGYLSSSLARLRYEASRDYNCGSE